MSAAVIVCVMPPRQVSIPRGSTVGQFLDRARTEIQKDFKELRNAPVENLLYVPARSLFFFYDNS
jgi:hypothetical protein